MTTAFLSLGSNLGDRLEYLARAVRHLQDERTVLSGCSSVYETAPQGKTDQPAFFNLVLRVQTERTARELLDQIQSVERALGRERQERWGPRTVDIDILLYGEEKIVDGDLEVPHPRMNARAFVLVPLQELSPALHLLGKEMHALIAAVSDQPVTVHQNADSFLPLVSGVK